jgi:hypothetical protein
VDVKQALVQLLYRSSAPVQAGLGFTGISRDIESMLGASDPRGFLVVRAQDEEEEATHFEWVGKCGEYGFHLEVTLSQHDAFVELRDAMASDDVAGYISRLKATPTLMGF